MRHTKPNTPSQVRDEDIAWAVMLAHRGELRKYVDRAIESGELYDAPTSEELAKLEEADIIDLTGANIMVP